MADRRAKLAKEVITAELEKAGFKVRKIILFGSRAREDWRDDSDWDFFVLIDREIDFPHKRKICTRIRRKLIKLDISADIILQSEATANLREGNVGYLTYYVTREGKIL
jgi:predicted nucleotidyltransferase